jgi:hypothetical protein
MDDHRRESLNEGHAADAMPAASNHPALQAGRSARIRRAQALVRRFSTHDYGVEDFLRDKRAEGMALWQV